MSHSIFRTIRISNPRFEHDHLRHMTVKSPALKRRGDISLFVPPDSPPDTPLVLLLHGVYGSHWSWSMGGGAHLTARRLIEAGKIPPLVLAMPSDGLWGDGSGYLPHLGANYEKWIVDEVPQAVHSVIESVTPSSPQFIAGLSMGGFGALRLGGKYAARFAGISAHSAITHFEQMAHFVEEPLELYDANPADYRVVDALTAAVLPPLRFDCGNEDALLKANRTLHQALTSAGVNHLYEEFQGGHEWAYWEQHLEDTLIFFADILAANP